MLATAKNILNCASSKVDGEMSSETRKSEARSKDVQKSNTDENQVLSEEDDDEAHDDSNEGVQRIAAMKKLVRAKCGHQSLRPPATLNKMKH